MENMGTVGRVFRSKGVVFISFDNVQSGLVLMHGVEDDLGKGREHYLTEALEE